MDPLETLLKPLTALLNRRIGEQTPARELAAELEGRVLAVRVRDSALAAYIVVSDGAVLLTGEYLEEPDAIVSGSLLSLAKLAGPEREAALKVGILELGGDAGTADRFRRLLSYARPDLEEALSDVVGDVVAHAVGDAARGVARWGSELRKTMRQNVIEYLQEESRAAPSRYEVDRFRDEVDGLRDRAARLEARLARLEAGS